ncbi:MAG: heavy metal-responsive transcriptional regulator [Phycisphaerales bacterium]|jgi:DNA-binding transcriptional MerR regulator|nr:heavy metal-responsive transcriptional regulator [Phycisphaerales bacterium]
MDAYTIGQLAAAAGVPTSTVRFYERAGLVKPDFRTGGNYRGYGALALERLKFIRSAQATGLSLQDIESLLQLTFSTQQPCAEVLTLMRKRLEEIRKRIKELLHVEKVLAKSLDSCCTGAGRDICDDICRLKGADPAWCKPSKKKCNPRA